MVRTSAASQARVVMPTPARLGAPGATGARARTGHDSAIRTDWRPHSAGTTGWPIAYSPEPFQRNHGEFDWRRSWHCSAISGDHAPHSRNVRTARYHQSGTNRVQHQRSRSALRAGHRTGEG